MNDFGSMLTHGFSATYRDTASVTGWNSLDVMSVEYFPTNVRSMGMGCLAASGRCYERTPLRLFFKFVNNSLQARVHCCPIY
jgi:hypothetical protein